MDNDCISRNLPSLIWGRHVVTHPSPLLCNSTHPYVLGCIFLGLFQVLLVQLVALLAQSLQGSVIVAESALQLHQMAALGLVLP